MVIVVVVVVVVVAGGVQNRLKKKAAQLGTKPKPYDFMFWTNLYMAITAALLSLALGEGSHTHTHTCMHHSIRNISSYRTYIHFNTVSVLHSITCSIYEQLHTYISNQCTLLDFHSLNKYIHT